jgi:hypothetical protein
MYWKGKKTVGVFYKKAKVNAIYRYGLIVWNAINSCFGLGYWINKQPWNNKDGWLN